MHIKTIQLKRFWGSTSTGMIVCLALSARHAATSSPSRRATSSLRKSPSRSRLSVAS